MQDNSNANDRLTAANPQHTAPKDSLIDAAGMKGISNVLGVASNNNPIFNINSLVGLSQSYVAMNMLVNSLFGYDVKWFRAVPQKRSMDVIFQEYTLSNVDDCPLDIKVIFPGGKMTDSKYNYDLMGLEYEIPLEIQIDKRYWESIAGFGTAPQKKDIVYIIISNKLYQVESSYLIRGFMEQETAWKINLVKYQPESSRKEGPMLKETIDKYTVSAEEIFGESVKNDVEQIINDKQFNQFNATSQDKYKKINPDLKSITESINIYGTTIAESFYDMQTSSWFDAIIYNTSDVINKNMNRSITSWVKPLESNNRIYNVVSINNIVNTLTQEELDLFDKELFTKANYTLSLEYGSLLSDININDIVLITQSGSIRFYVKVVAISKNPLKYHCIINPFVLQYLNDLTSTPGQWINQRGYKIQSHLPISIIDGIDESNKHVLGVNIYANQYIAINYSHTYSKDNSYVIRLDEKMENNKWYGVVVNIGNTWGQCNVCVWEKHDTDSNAKLKLILSKVIKLHPTDIFVQNYSINKSHSHLTNIRIFNTTIEEEKQHIELLSQFSKDGDKLILSDSGGPILRLPFISRQR